ncbi:MAG: hypothetical protein ACRC1M_07945 [Methanobacteriaceae archaeon]
MEKKKILIFIGIIIVVLGAYIVFMGLTTYPSTTLGENELGKVSIEGPYGNPDSPNKIAVIAGVHPLESNSHNSLLKHLRQYSNSLNSSYYVYIINVTKDQDDFDKGRMNGQLLAKEYAVPDITSKNYTFSVDFHAHRGVYEEKNFIIAPLNDIKSAKIGKEIIKNITGMKILNFTPATDGKPTSPDYVSIPILKNGTPSLIYETYINESETVTDNFMSKFLMNLDNTKF